MIATNCMKSMNTIRIAVPKLVREAMQLSRGSRIMFEVTGPGECKIYNLDRLVRLGLEKDQSK